MAVFLRERNNVELFDSVPETLALLRSRGYVLGTITNGNADVEQTVKNPPDLHRPRSIHAPEAFTFRIFLRLFPTLDREKD